MSASSMTKSVTGAAYKTHWRRLLELRGKSGMAAFERATLLVKVFEDQDFRADNSCSDDIAAAEVLDDLVGDLALQFFELRSLLEYYPDKTEWRDGRLRSMYTKMRDDKAARKKEERAAVGHGITRQRITKEEFSQAQEEVKHEKARSRIIEDQMTKLEKENQRLHSENSQLRIENATLKGRIEELERTIGRK